VSGRHEQIVSEYFEEQVQAAPEDLAFVFDGHELSYAELNLRANEVAWWLHEKKIGPESVVAISMRRGVPLATAILGIMKAGGAYLPLDLDDPPARRSQMLLDAGAVLTIADQAPDGDGAGGGVPLCVLPSDLTAYPGSDPPALACADNLLYVVYTSGSTGQPKGIAMCHGPTARLMQWSGQAHRRRSRTLHYFPITSDVGSYELMATWLSGGCVVMASEQDRYDVGRLSALIERYKIETVLLPFLALDQLARGYPDYAESLKSLTEIVTTGDRLVVTPAVRAMCSALDIELLENQWGATEVNVVTAACLRQPAQEWPETPSIGSPVAGARIYVADDNLALSPVNVPGALYVGGTPLARGYAGRPDLTALAFVPDPFASEPGQRMYRTGDLGRWRLDGELEFRGRADFQLKVHGYRVEPEEIQAALRSAAGVAETVVIAMDLGADQPGLVAYIVPDGDPPDATRLRDELRGRLPGYMMPAHYVTLDRLPRTATGKVDRSLLPAPIAADAGARTDPRDQAEKAIAAIWQETLGVESVTAEDNFFVLGGHSLLVNQVIYRLNTELGIELPIRVLFEAPTLAELADRVRELNDVMISRGN
jgi:amino acid adenylation domain-containing protein